MFTPENNITPRVNAKKHVAFLVHDNLLAETMLVRLQKKGFQTNIYYTSEIFESAIEKKGTYPDALIIDMDYFDFSDLPSLQNGANSKGAKIFVLSSENDMKARLKAVKAHVSDFIPKPLDADELTKKITASFGLEKRTVHDVLIVDDDPLTLKLCQKLLEPENVRVRFVETPIDTLEELKRHKPDLILLDYYMPYANGLDINRVIRQIYSISEIPVLFMTGSKDQKILSDIRKETHLDPILKPITQGDFLGQVFAAME